MITKKRKNNAGFTLVEVMVALAIVALAVPALLFTLDQQIDGSSYLRDRSLAQIVAVNRLAELRHRVKSELNPQFKIYDLVVADALPRTASNKLMRRTLRADYRG